MSIPIAARRYIADLGLSNRKWKKLACIVNCEEALIICNADKAFGIYHGFLFSEGWVFYNFHARDFQPLSNIVCWSEIKI